MSPLRERRSTTCIFAQWNQPSAPSQLSSIRLRRVDDERVAVPASDRVAHPRLSRRPRLCGAAVGRDRAERVAPLVEQHDETRRLHDLAGRSHARHAERFAVERRIVELPLVRQHLDLRRDAPAYGRLVRLGRLASFAALIHLVEDALVVGLVRTGKRMRVDSPGARALTGSAPARRRRRSDPDDRRRARGVGFAAAAALRRHPAGAAPTLRERVATPRRPARGLATMKCFVTLHLQAQGPPYGFL